MKTKRVLNAFQSEKFTTLRTSFDGAHTVKVPNELLSNGTFENKPAIELKGELYRVKNYKLFDKSNPFVLKALHSLLQRGYEGELNGKALSFIDLETLTYAGLKKVDMNDSLKFVPNFSLVYDGKEVRFMSATSIPVNSVIKYDGKFFTVTSVDKDKTMRTLNYSPFEYISLPSVYQFIPTVGAPTHSEYEDYVDFLLARHYYNKGLI